MSTELTTDKSNEIRKAHARKMRQRRDSRAVNRVMTVLSTVQDWVAADERIARVYVSTEQGTFHLRLIAVSPKADFDLTTSLTNLAISLTDRGIDTVCSLVPDGTPEELTAFFDPTDAFVISRR